MPDEERRCCCSRGRDGGCGRQNKSECGKKGGCSGGCGDRVIYVTEDESAFLTKLSQLPFLPLARFVTRDVQSGDISAVVRAPVYMEDKNESEGSVSKTGNTLLSLEDKYLITLDYDLPLENGDYSVYEESALFRAFCESARQGVCPDQPVLERGSIALTSLGQDALDSIE